MTRRIAFWWSAYPDRKWPSLSYQSPCCLSSSPFTYCTTAPFTASTRYPPSKDARSSWSLRYVSRMCNENACRRRQGDGCSMYDGFMVGTRDTASPLLQLQGSLSAHESPPAPGHHNRRTQVRHEGTAGDALPASSNTEGGRRGPLLRP